MTASRSVSICPASIPRLHCEFGCGCAGIRYNGHVGTYSYIDRSVVVSCGPSGAVAFPACSPYTATDMDNIFDTLDINTYSRLPNTTAASLLALARALRRRQPADSTEQVMLAGKDLEESILEIEAAMLARRRGEVTPEYGSATQYDAAVDGLWGALRARLLALQAFEHPGLDPIINRVDDPLGDLLGKCRRKSQRAQAIVAQLFGDEGLRFIKLPFIEQAEVMSTILSLIDEAELEAETDELAGVPMVDVLRGCQGFYRTMVEDRLGGDDLNAAAMGELRRDLARAVVQYNVAIFATLNRKNPTSAQVVAHALKPVVVLRQYVAEGRSYTDETAAATDEIDGIPDQPNTPPPAAEPLPDA
jgi:hypothetical protein